ncbi:MAG: endonuclease/exonuclease/phosphatase family protein [Phycisphaerales bacterium]|nr:endonuclease/exonuclease/phosphatase family protein [Phycisphaerales bacterium]
MPEEEQTTPELKPEPKQRKKRSKIVTIFVWGMVILLVPACTLWFFGRWIYVADVLASQQMLIGWIALFVAFLIFITRRKGAGFLCLTLALISFFPVLTHRVWVLPEVNFELKPQGVVRIVSSNINPKNPDWQADLDRLLDLDADIVVLIEVSAELNRSIRKRGLLDSSPYSRWAHRAWVEYETSPCFILSRLPMRIIDTSENEDFAQDLLYTQIETARGTLIVGLAHPLSPRTQSRWIEGNMAITAQTQAIGKIRKTSDAPVLLCADLNAGPAQWRARQLRTAGLSMSKPVLRIGGSFPTNSSVPSALRVQLDDIWLAGKISPIAWSMIDVAGSDHMAVVADFVLEDEVLGD